MSENTAAPRFTPPTVDPWKGLRGVMAGTLILELIVVLLCLPVVWKIGGGLTWISGGYLGLIAVAMVLACGMQGRPYALQLDLALQVAIIVGGVFSLVDRGHRRGVPERLALHRLHQTRHSATYRRGSASGSAPHRRDIVLQRSSHGSGPARPVAGTLRVTVVISGGNCDNGCWCEQPGAPVYV